MNKIPAIFLLLLTFALISSNCKTQTVSNIPETNDSFGQFLSASPLPLPSSSQKAVLKETAEKIAFMSNRTGFWDIYTMNTDGSEQKRVTSDEMKGPFAFAFSPDGKKLAYISDKTGNPDLWVMNLSTGEKTQMTDTELAEEGSPTWMSDNETLVFHSNSSGSYFKIIQTSYPVKVPPPKFQTLISKSDSNVLHPSFSPNGNSLLYSLIDSSGTSLLVVYDNLKKKEVIITKKEDQAINGIWNPDGNKIIYWTNSNGIFQINTDGTNKSSIGTIKNIKGNPVFSPDGSKIALSRGFGFSEDYDVWVMDYSGRNPQKLTEQGGISINWYKNNISPTPVSSSVVSSPSPSSSGKPYIDPNDSLINPLK